MTLDELIEQLEEIKESLGHGDAEVRMAFQPNWPLESSLKAVLNWREVVAENTLCYDEDEDDQPEDDETDIVYLVEGNQIGYSHGCLWNC